MGTGLTSGQKVDRINVEDGLRALTTCGYTEPRTHLAIEHALRRWASGEEEAASRGAIDRSRDGIDLTTWIRVLTCSMAAAESRAPVAA